MRVVLGWNRSTLPDTGATKVRGATGQNPLGDPPDVLKKASNQSFLSKRPWVNVTESQPGWDNVKAKVPETMPGPGSRRVMISWPRTRKPGL